jgi:guanine deaminase
MLNGLRAFLLSSSDSGRLQAYPDGAIIWNESGRITFAGNWKDRPLNRKVRWEDQQGKLVTPGFIDVHCHLSQYPVVACGGQELLPWLKKFIFPCEQAFSPQKAETEAPLFFSELKRHGITSAAVYTTVDAKSTEVCFQAAQASRLRITMGQMMMDVGSYAPKPHRNLAHRVLNESATLCQRWHQANAGRLLYAFSPRFALTCSEGLLRESAKLARQAGAFVQTHLAENRAELIAVKNLFPSAKDYTQKPASPAELFHLATVSSAGVPGKQTEIGQFRKGFLADCALWDTENLLPYGSELPHNPKELVSLLIY